MTEMQQTTEEIAGVKDEIKTRKKREKERHERNMEEIEEDEEQMKEDLKDEFGVSEVESRLDEINKTAREHSSIASEVASLVRLRFTDYLSGSYDSKITVKNGSFRKYRKKRNASLSIFDVGRRYRGTIKSAIKGHPDNGSLMAALDMLMDNKDMLQTTTIESEKVGISLGGNWNEDIDRMKVKVTSNRYNSRRSYQHKIVFGDEDYHIHVRESFSSPYDSWNAIEMIAQVTDEIAENLEELERKWEQKLHEAKQVQKRIENVLGVEEESPDVEAHIGESPPISAESDETIAYVECMGSGKLGTQKILGQEDGGWVTADNERKEMFQNVYDALEELTDGRKMRSAGKQFYVLRLDEEENITDVWTYERYLKSAVDAEKLSEAVKNAA